MAEEKTAKQGAIAVPPYLSYRTFDGFVRGLKVGIPMRIDRSALRSMSGGVGAALMSALRYLGLITPHADTTEKLAALVNSEGAERERVLTGILQDAYSFLFRDFDLQRATTGQLEEAFRKVGASGDTIRKCVAFFLAAAKNAGIAVSPHVKVSGISRAPNRIRKIGATSGDGGQRDELEEYSSPQNPTPMTSWTQMLLTKFPSFDPSWPDEVKTKWFESFHRLMRVGDSKADPE